MSKDNRHPLSILTSEEFEAHKKLMEDVRRAEPKQSCEMIRAWIKLNVEASVIPVWNN